MADRDRADHDAVLRQSEPGEQRLCRRVEPEEQRAEAGIVRGVRPLS